MNNSLLRAFVLCISIHSCMGTQLPGPPVVQWQSTASTTVPVDQTTDLILSFSSPVASGTLVGMMVFFRNSSARQIAPITCTANAGPIPGQNLRVQVDCCEMYHWSVLTITSSVQTLTVTFNTPGVAGGWLYAIPSAGKVYGTAQQTVLPSNPPTISSGPLDTSVNASGAICTWLVGAGFSSVSLTLDTQFNDMGSMGEMVVGYGQVSTGPVWSFLPMLTVASSGNGIWGMMMLAMKSDCSATYSPTGAPTAQPTSAPTGAPTASPTSAPTSAPTFAPTTAAPTPAPTTAAPTLAPTIGPFGLPLMTNFSGPTVLVGDYYIPPGVILQTLGNLTIRGNFSIFGTLTVAANDVLHAESNLLLQGMLISSSPIIVGGQFVINPGAVYAPLVQATPAAGVPVIQFPVASFASISGTLIVGPAIANYSGSCLTLGQPTLSQGVTSITVAIPVSASGCTSGLSGAVIAGIVIGCLVFALAALTAVLGVMRRKKLLERQREARQTALQKEEQDATERRRADEMRAYFTSELDDPSHRAYEAKNDPARSGISNNIAVAD